MNPPPDIRAGLDAILDELTRLWAEEAVRGSSGLPRADPHGRMAESGAAECGNTATAPDPQREKGTRGLRQS